MAPSSTDMGRRWSVAALTGLLLVAGVWDLGGRADSDRVLLTECFEDSASCIGQSVTVDYHRIVELRDDGVLVLSRSGRGVEVLGADPHALRSAGSLAKVSVAGTWAGPARVVAQRLMVHRVRRLKEGVGLLGLLVSLGLFARFAWGRRG